AVGGDPTAASVRCEQLDPRNRAQDSSGSCSPPDRARARVARSPHQREPCPLPRTSGLTMPTQPLTVRAKFRGAKWAFLRRYAWPTLGRASDASGWALESPHSLWESRAAGSWFISVRGRLGVFFCFSPSLSARLA